MGKLNVKTILLSSATLLSLSACGTTDGGVASNAFLDNVAAPITDVPAELPKTDVLQPVISQPIVSIPTQVEPSAIVSDVVEQLPAQPSEVVIDPVATLPAALPEVLPATSPIVEQPVVVVVAEPLAQPVAQPIAEPVAEPMAQPIAQPVASLPAQSLPADVDGDDDALPTLPTSSQPAAQVETSVINPAVNLPAANVSAPIPAEIEIDGASNHTDTKLTNDTAQCSYKKSGVTYRIVKKNNKFTLVKTTRYKLVKCTNGVKAKQIVKSKVSWTISFVLGK